MFEMRFGDTTFLAVPAHKSLIGNEGDFFQWGPIFATTLPTASRDETGSGRWSLGPGILALRNKTKTFNDKLAASPTTRVARFDQGRSFLAE
jgi:hypothetical protein